jgi:hypothetical protein
MRRRGPELLFVTKSKKLMYILHLDHFTYRRVSTRFGRFNGQPDTLELVGGELLLCTEDGGGSTTGIFAQRANDPNRYYTILESSAYSDETTGLALSPDKKHLYFAYQDSGVLFDVTRDDGRPFDGDNMYISTSLNKRGLCDSFSFPPS